MFIVNGEPFSTIIPMTLSDILAPTLEFYNPSKPGGQTQQNCSFLLKGFAKLKSKARKDDHPTTLFMSQHLTDYVKRVLNDLGVDAEIIFR